MDDSLHVMPLELQDTHRLSTRLAELRLFSPVLARETSVRVLTPEGFDASVDPLPVLFLLHGGGDDSDHTNWTVKGGAEALTAGLPLVVVMPDGGKGGWYTNWRSGGTVEGSQQWETYHLCELLPFVQRHYATRSDRAGTAIAGLSMGGFGAVHYAARRPDLFGFAASFSGAVDVLHRGVARVIRISPLIMGGAKGDIWGDREANEPQWRANNPVDLAANLASVELQLRTGNGQPGGPLGDYPDGRDDQEIGVGEATASLHRRLDELGVAHFYDDYGAGAHTWPYWDAALAATLPSVVEAAKARRPPPTTVDHLAYEPAFSVWGHDVVLERSNLEPAVLSIRPDGFALHGRGRATVTVPPRYAPDGSVSTTITTGAVDDDPTPDARQVLQADDQGRVEVAVDLGEAPVPTGVLRDTPMVDVTIDIPRP